MITPRFTCSQTAAAVVVRIYVPAVRGFHILTWAPARQASDVELHVDGSLFSVHISPYFLRLDFPGEIVEDDASCAAYDPASGNLTVTLTKAIPGEDFKDLDVLAKLLAPPKRDEPAPQPAIEVLDSEDAEEVPQTAEIDLAEATKQLSLDQREVLQAAENDWQIPQQTPQSPLPYSVQISTERRYGFLNAYTGYFSHVALTENEVNELGDEAEKLTEEERRLRRLKHEEEKWDEEYYMADFVDDEYIQEIIAYRPPPEAPCSPDLSNPLVFTEEENAEMLRLPRKECKYSFLESEDLATPLQKHGLYLTLMSILFSYAYDARTTQNDPTPESAWTICSLTPAFTALDPPPYAPPTGTPLTFTSADIQSALTPSIRRALAFPLYRSFALAERCLRDVCTVLGHGRRAVLRALFATKRVLDHHEVYYIYSKIWVDDFCRWVASDASEEMLRGLGQALAGTRFDKRSVGWDLVELEAAARQQAARAPDSDDESEAGGDGSDGADAASDASSSPSSSSSSSSTLSSSGASSSSSSSSDSGSVSLQTSATKH
ncbi:SHQ1-domain-containing protein [Phellopilus nigrolimitatus]|nr:SHQ1-domain-containing protein [Phellopilus nigrolimitatus]